MAFTQNVLRRLPCSTKRQAAFSAAVVPFVGRRAATIGRRSRRRRHPMNYAVTFQRSIVMLFHSHGSSSAFVSCVRLNSPLFYCSHRMCKSITAQMFERGKISVVITTSLCISCCCCCCCCIRLCFRCSLRLAPIAHCNVRTAPIVLGRAIAYVRRINGSWRSKLLKRGQGRQPADP